MIECNEHDLMDVYSKGKMKSYERMVGIETNEPGDQER